MREKKENAHLHLRVCLIMTFHRGLVPVLLLKHLERECGQKISQLFDYVCGTSTGALLAGMLFMKQMEILEVEDLYKELSGQIFKQNNLLGIGQLFLNQSFYDSTLFEKLLRDVPMSELMMYESSAYSEVPRVRMISLHAFVVHFLLSSDCFCVNSGQPASHRVFPVHQLPSQTYFSVKLSLNV